MSPLSALDALEMIRAVAGDQLRMHQVNGDGQGCEARIHAIIEEASEGILLAKMNAENVAVLNAKLNAALRILHRWKDSAGERPSAGPYTDTAAFLEAAAPPATKPEGK